MIVYQELLAVISVIVKVKLTGKFDRHFDNQERKASTSHIQRQLKIGHNMAANTMEELQKIVSCEPPTTGRNRECPMIASLVEACI